MRQNNSPGGLMRWLTPTQDSSWIQLRVHAIAWTLFTALWISWQFWGDGSALRRLLFILLTVVSITQALNTVGLMRKKRERESGGPR